MGLQVLKVSTFCKKIVATPCVALPAMRQQCQGFSLDLKDLAKFENNNSNKNREPRYLAINEWF